MKTGWATKKLGEVCEILDSRRIPITRSNRKPGSIPYYGATGQVDSVADFIFNEDLLLLGEDGTVLEPEFLCYSLITPANKHLLLGIGEAGSTRQALTKSDLSNFVIQIPSIKLQREIIQKVSELSYCVAALEQNFLRQIADCAEMRQSVLREAFEGRL